MSKRRKNREGTYFTDRASGLLGWRIQVDGKTLTRKAKTPKALAAKIKTALQEVEARGTILGRVDRNMITTDYLQAWLSVVKETKKHPTYDQYRQSVDRISKHLDSIPLGKLTSGVVQRIWISHQKQGYSRRTIDMDRSTLRNALNAAVNSVPPLITVNPVPPTKTPAEATPPKELRSLSQQDASRLLSYLLSEVPLVTKPGEVRLRVPTGPFLAFLLATGLRSSEGIGVSIADIDQASATLRVWRRVLWITESEWKWDELKGKKSRTIALSGRAMEACNIAIQQVAKHQARIGKYYSDHGILFAAENGQPIRASTARRALNTALESLGLEHFTLHDLRRSFGSVYAANNPNPKDLQIHLGHENIQTTFKHYVVALDESKRKAVEIF